MGLSFPTQEATALEIEAWVKDLKEGKVDSYHLYQNRGAGRDCIRFGNPKEPCWGSVQGSSRGLECHGHFGGGSYQIPDNRTAAFAEKLKRDIRENQERRLKEIEEKKLQEEARWFRPYIQRASKLEPDPWWQGISDPLLKFIFSMFGEGLRCGWIGPPSSKWGPILVEAALPAIAEVIRRHLEFPVGAYELRLVPEDCDGVPLCSLSIGWNPEPLNAQDLVIDLSVLSDVYLQLWHGCAGQVMDYSCLERGTRQVVTVLYDKTRVELERRGLECLCLFDLPEE